MTGTSCSAAARATCRPDGRRAGEEQVIELRRGERAPDVGIARHDGELVLGEAPRDELGDQRRGPRRELGGLHQHAIAGGERAGRRHDRELERVVPRRDDADDTERLRQDFAAPGQQRERRGNAPRSHPARQIAQRVANAVGARSRISASRVSCAERPPKSASIASTIALSCSRVRLEQPLRAGRAVPRATDSARARTPRAAAHAVARDSRSPPRSATRPARSRPVAHAGIDRV